MAMTSDAKRLLSATIRSLRARLLDDLHAATESAYRLSIRQQDAGLNQAARTRRARLEAWVAEQLRAQGAAVAKDGKDKGARTADDFRRDVEKQAAYTLLNRLVILRLMEAPGDGRPALRPTAVVTGGWESPAYRQFRELAAALTRDDETEGYAFLLQLVFQDLATELPGIYGSAGLADLIPIPAATLRHIVEALNQPDLDSCWTDDMTLGWVYQYWNDPEREDIDKRLNAGGKVQPHEIASKTQLFTERYMVDWLLQNSLGPMWLAMCKKHGWTPEVESDGTLQRLEERRTGWRARRDAGEVSLTELMPLHSDDERRWAYYVPQPIPDDAVEKAPASVRDIRVLDPAVGSGHFLVVAIDLLVAMHREEARHRGEADNDRWTDRAIVEHILAYNLHGIDLDPRAVQIAAAGLWLKAHEYSKDAHPERLNLVASNLRLASLADDDPALVELRHEVERETGIPAALTDTIVHALRGADHLGSLLKIDKAVDEAIEAHEQSVRLQFDPQQLGIFGEAPPQQARIAFEAAEAKRSLLDSLEGFLARHTGGDDLGLRLHGEQLAAGVRFARMLREGTYDLVVANPPYQGTSKMTDVRYVEAHYPLGKADLYAAFLLRGLELVRDGGVSAMLTMRNWMFIKQFKDLRPFLLRTSSLRAIGDFEIGAFEEVGGMVVSVCASVLERSSSPSAKAAALRLVDGGGSGNATRTIRKRAATLCHVGRFEFEPTALKVVPEWPLVYWWTKDLLDDYRNLPLLGQVASTATAQSTGNNDRYRRRIWEHRESPYAFPSLTRWHAYVGGADGASWFEPRRTTLNWRLLGIEIKLEKSLQQGRDAFMLASEDQFGRVGITFPKIGRSFSARMFRVPSIFGDAAPAVFAENPIPALCLLNSQRAKSVLSDLNPTVNFGLEDVQRLPVRKLRDAEVIFSRIEESFAVHESHREPSVEFKRPGPSPWRHAQEWAQVAVDRPEGEPLAPYEPEYDAEPPTDHLSFALGVALGRFGARGEGILDPAKDNFTHALLAGVLFLDGTLDGEDRRDSLGHPAAGPLLAAWDAYGPAIGTNRSSLREWLSLDFFKDVHKGMYENRPIHWPLSSAQKTFVAWVNIHQFDERTLRILLADHLNPAINRIEGELNDLRAARDGANRSAARASERRYDKVLKARDELRDFITNVEQCADRGAPPMDAKCPVRELDARYSPDLDDGVMVNTAGLWPLLEPQWKDPKKWWKQLAEAKGTKDYDWSHLAMRCWPTRVDEKCKKDPSLGVAHGCFWRYHPQRAWAWELRLQDEIGPDFRIDEAPYTPGGRDVGDAGSGPHRDAWIRDHATAALAGVAKEALRRIRRNKGKQPIPEMRILERSLWSALSADVWDMELRLSEKQGAEFRLLAPDEPEARAAYEAAYPDEVEARKQLLAQLASMAGLYDDAEDGEEEEDVDVRDDDAPDGGGTDVEDDE